MENFHTVVAGAGPGGLACATKLAQNGISVLLLEKKKLIGPKVCAGGVTWSGLSQHLPPELIEKKFPDQYIYTDWQKVKISAHEPIICTVDRPALGRWMHTKAKTAGVIIRTGTPIIQLGKQFVRTKDGTINFQYLIGADGSSSLVRRHIGLSSQRIGVGINCHISAVLDRMEWHLRPELFHTGYAWIFPHKNKASIGAYVCRKDMSARMLLHNFQQWADMQGFDISNMQPQAALINYDYQGHDFGNILLVGDAAGLASGLTGEGIYPAIISGEAAADKILGKTGSQKQLVRLIKKQAMHTRLIEFAGKNRTGCKIIMETLVLGLRNGLIHFNALEMGNNNSGR